MDLPLIKEQVRHHMFKFSKEAYTLGLVIPLIVITLVSVIFIALIPIALINLVAFFIAFISPFALSYGIATSYLSHIRMGLSGYDITPLPEFTDNMRENVFRYTKGAFLTVLLSSLWSLLFIIPGVVRSIDYSMTPYLLKDNEEMSTQRAIGRSQDLIKGVRLDYVKLYFYYNWHILLTNILFGLSSYLFLESVFSHTVSPMWVTIYFGISALLLLVIVVLSVFVIPRWNIAKVYFYKQLVK